MKYDAKCSDNQGNPLTSPDNNPPYHVYSNSTQNCTGNLSVVSTPNGYPITNIAEIDAKKYCASLGGHLITNDEWMTIAYNVVNQGNNWSGGSVGNGAVYIGHSDSSPNNASQASNDDTQGYFGTDGPVSGGGTGSNTTQKRTLSLSNGSVIWDFAGNIDQEVQRSSMNIGDNTNTITTPTCSAGTFGAVEFCQYGNSISPYITVYNDSSFSASTIGPPNSSWNSNQGMGRVLGYDGATGGNTFLRGGDWGNGTNDGPFTLYLHWYTGSPNDSVGFRCVR
jgi:hypothetical protein